MLLLLGFAFIAGLVTILSPCILPILPIVLSGALSGGKWRPLGVVTGFILSFTFFAVFSFTIAKALGISTEILRNISVVLLILFGASMFISQIQLWLEGFASKFSSFGQQKREGFTGGVVLGVSLGFVWTPCVGPILASVLTLAATSQITSQLVLITLAFSLGTAIPMLLIGYGGKHVLEKLPALRERSGQIQKIFGVLIIATALLIFFNLDRKFQTYILKTFPNYGTGLTSFEDNEAVQEELLKLEDRDSDSSDEESSLLNFESLLETMTAAPAPNPDFVGGTKWVNSEPLSLNDELKGKVVLIDFWTYTCINCIRTFPHVTSWYNTYKDDGFVIVGVHTPEFEFEKKEENVLDAMEEYGITYPVVQDNDFKIWRSYNNRYWPAHYLIDRNGQVRYTHFGEGKYDETEAMIRKLLEEDGEVTSDMTGLEDETPRNRRSPESYLGYARLDRFASPERVVRDRQSTYSIPPGLPLHILAYGGDWTVTPEHARSTKNSEIDFHFEGRDVFLVMRPAGGTAGRVEVYLDGELISPGVAGEDVVNGTVTVDSDRLYKLVRFDAVEKHDLKLRFTGEPIEAFAFTFG